VNSLDRIIELASELSIGRHDRVRLAVDCRGREYAIAVEVDGHVLSMAKERSYEAAVVVTVANLEHVVEARSAATVLEAAT